MSKLSNNATAESLGLERVSSEICVERPKTVDLVAARTTTALDVSVVGKQRALLEVAKVRTADR
jgi:hypothetical protein